MLERLWREEDGQTLVEYAMMMAVLSFVVVLVLTAIGHRVSDNFYDAGTGLDVPRGPQQPGNPHPNFA